MREIKPINHNGNIQLKFSYGGKRYSFNPIPGGHYNTKRDLANARAIATQIQNDILAGNFDQTLNRYRLAPKKSQEVCKPTTLLQLWDLWVSSLDVSESARATHYRWVRVMISKASPDLTDVSWLNKLNLASATLKERISLIKSCCSWGITQGYLESNPYQSIKTRGDKPKDIKPFTSEEVRLIIEGFDKLYPHYTPFVKFLLITGCRTSEAIGLCWQHIDLLKGEVVIKESLSKDVTGNGYQRIRKGTKTGDIRYLSLPDHLRSLLEEIKPVGANPDDLVFTTPRGKHIDQDTFRKSYWVKVLKHQEIPYRKPYTTRHTMVSHAIDQGIPLTGVAYLAGHKDISMIIKNYGHMINRPELPKLPID